VDADEVVLEDALGVLLEEEDKAAIGIGHGEGLGCFGVRAGARPRTAPGPLMKPATYAFVFGGWRTLAMCVRAPAKSWEEEEEEARLRAPLVASALAELMDGDGCLRCWKTRRIAAIVSALSAPASLPGALGAGEFPN
jgi:hypothetical protein